MGSAPHSVPTFATLDDLKGSSKPFFLILVCSRTSFTGSGSCLCSFWAGKSDLCSFTGRPGSTRGMCWSLRACLLVPSPLASGGEGELCCSCGGKEMVRFPSEALGPSLKTSRGAAAVLFSVPALILLTTELQWPPGGWRCLGFSATFGRLAFG